MTRFVRFASAIVAATALGWTVTLLLRGGGLVSIGPLRIRSTDPYRPAQLVIVAFVAFAAAGGLRSIQTAWRSIRTRVPMVDRLTSPVAMAWAAALFVVGLTCAYSTTTAGASDASGYVSQADRWLTGPLMPSQPWVGSVPWPNAAWSFSPLGYRPVEAIAPWRQAPVYSPGLPLLMAAAKSIGGQPALFLVVPLSAGLLVLATYGVSRRARNPQTGAVAAWLIATSPTVLWISMLAWSDVPTAAAWTLCAYFVLGETTASIVAAGLAAAVAILIRPNLVFLLPILGLWYFLRPAGNPAQTRMSRFRDLLLFVVAASPGIVFLLTFFAHLFGSPFVSGYGSISGMLDYRRVGTNIGLYGHWALTTEPVLTLVGLLGLGASACWTTTTGRRIRVSAALVLVSTVGEYLTYLVFQPEEWMYLRFLLPAWPMLALGAAAVFMWLRERYVRPWARLAVALMLVEIGLTGIATARNRSAFDLWRTERRYPAVSAAMRDLTPSGSLVIGLEFTGALRYYAGRVPLRYDLLDQAWLDRAVDWLRLQGVHVYAVLNVEEVDDFRKRFAGQHALVALAHPILRYETHAHGVTVLGYDLTTPQADSVVVRAVSDEDATSWRNALPGPEATLTLRPATSSGR